MRVTLVGVGGIGSHLADWVARFLAWSKDEHTLTLVDGDTFEERNAERQSFDKPGMKATTVAEMLGRRYPALRIEPVPEFLSPKNAEWVLLEEEIVLLCVDNHATRKFVSDYCGTLDNVSLISGGNDLDIGNVQIYLRRDGRDATPSLSQDHPEIAQPSGKPPYEMSCEELAAAGTPQIFFANLTAAVLMANAFWRLVTDPSGIVSRVKGDGIKIETAYTETCFDIFRNLVLSRRHNVAQETPNENIQEKTDHVSQEEGATR